MDTYWGKGYSSSRVPLPRHLNLTEPGRISRQQCNQNPNRQHETTEPPPPPIRLLVWLPFSNFQRTKCGGYVCDLLTGRELTRIVGGGRRTMECILLFQFASRNSCSNPERKQRYAIKFTFVCLRVCVCDSLFTFQCVFVRVKEKVPKRI